MKVKINNYTFNKTAKTVTFTDYSTVYQEGLLLITNTTDNVIIYNFSDPALGGTVSGNIVTLTYDTTSMADADKLLIYYDDGLATPTATETGLAVDEQSSWLLRRILKVLAPLGIVTAVTNRLNVDVNSIASITTGTLSSVSTVATVSTLTNQTNTGGVNSFVLVKDQARNAYANGVRNNIAFY